jgi:hypothetical protein
MLPAGDAPASCSGSGACAKASLRAFISSPAFAAAYKSHAAPRLIASFAGPYDRPKMFDAFKNEVHDVSHRSSYG